MSNLYSGIELAMMGRRVIHYSPACVVYLNTRRLGIEGTIGDVVSVLPLSDRALGVCEKGFEYPLDNVVLEKKNPYSISNTLLGEKGEISLDEGVLAVFHFLRLDE